MQIMVLITLIFAFENPVALLWLAPLVLAVPSLTPFSRSFFSEDGTGAGSVLGPAAGFTATCRRLVGMTFDWRRITTKILQ